MSFAPVVIYARDLPVLCEGEHIQSKLDEDKLMATFGQFANVDPIDVTVKTGKNQNGIPCAYAIIELVNHEDAKCLISKLNYKTVKKVPIHLVYFDEEAQNILKNDDGNALVIHDINASIQLQDLYEMFRPFGDIIDCEIPYGSDNIAYVLFRRSDDAKCAMKNLNGSAPTGVIPIQIELDHTKFFTKMFVLPKDQIESAPYQAEIQPIPENNIKSGDDINLSQENERLRKENAELKKKIENYEKSVKN